MYFDIRFRIRSVEQCQLGDVIADFAYFDEQCFLTVNVSIRGYSCSISNDCTYIYTNERKRAFERYRIARIVIKPRGWFPIGTRGISRLRITYTQGCACAWARTCMPYLKFPDSYIDPTDLISSSVIPWALTHLPTKEHLCEPIRNALATCSQVSLPYAQHEFIISLV